MTRMRSGVPLLSTLLSILASRSGSHRRVPRPGTVSEKGSHSYLPLWPSAAKNGPPKQGVPSELLRGGVSSGKYAYCEYNQ